MFKKAIPIWKKGAVCPDDYAEFRLSFAGRYDEAFILIAAGTDYTARLNGALISFGQYQDYPEHRVFDEINIG